MSKSFVITSHTEGKFPFEQRTILYGLVKSLRYYFPDCFIIIASQSDVDLESQQFANCLIIDKVTPDQPHGAGELALLSQSLDALKRFGRNDYYKLCYDFVIDDSNYKIFDQWASLGKEFVSCYWRTVGLGIGTWIWYSTIDMHERLFDFDQLNKHLEWRLLESVQEKNLIEQCYLYEDHNSMFNGDWYTRCDLVHAGGNVLKYNYGNIVVVIDLSDESEQYIPMLIDSVINQSKSPAHLVIVDSRTNKKDLRTIDLYQDLFTRLADKRISWNLIYYAGQEQILKHLDDLGHTWCLLLNSKKFLDKHAVKHFYQSVILTYNVGTISDQQGNLFYRNESIPIDSLNTDMRIYIVDKMKETCYINIDT